MEARKLRLGFLLAAGATALAFALPLAPEAASLLARPLVPEIAATAVLLFLLAVALLVGADR